jgi:16S rRNA (guanine527-N7)-methyltransferase
LTATSEPPGPPELGAQAAAAVEELLSQLATDPTAPSSVTDRERAREVHVADSLSGLVLPELATAERICDLGAGAGFPGLVLAAALPGARVDLLDSVSRKCEFMRRAAERAGLGNVGIVCERAESWGGGEGAGAYDVVTARAVGRLSTLAELASPLLADGGCLIAWKGRRDPDEEAELERAAEALAMYPQRIVAVGPYAGSRHRHLHLIVKRGATPADLPRRDGMAKKRPRGA